MMTMIWTAAIIIFGIVEAVTTGLVSIWFVIGALAALAAALLHASLAIQLVLFLAGSAAALALTRPALKRITGSTATPTNADRVLGETVRVTETIDNESSTGAVYADGKTWTARSGNGTVIPVGSQVRVEAIEGVKLFVTMLEEQKEEAFYDR